MAGNLVALALYSLMPSLLKWNYLPGIAEDELPVEQRVFPGDMVIYDGEQGRIDGEPAPTPAPALAPAPAPA